MNRSVKRWILLLVMVIALTGSVILLREYFRTPESMIDATADWSGTEAELAMAFNTNEQEANSRFLGKVLEVKGIVDNVSSEGDSIFNVMLGKGGNGNVSCTMSPSQNEDVRKLRSGDTVSIKGECAGFLADVELNRCVLVK